VENQQQLAGDGADELMAADTGGYGSPAQVLRIFVGLAAVVGTAGGRYTRYCDDMAMSFQSSAIVEKFVMSKAAGTAVLNPAIENVITKHGFVVNKNKLKVRSRRERQEVTGIVVNERLNVRREFVRELHTQLHCVERFGLSKAAARYFELRKAVPASTPEGAFAAILRGRILFVKMVRGNGDSVFATLAKRFNAARIIPARLPTIAGQLRSRICIRPFGSSKWRTTIPSTVSSPRKEQRFCWRAWGWSPARTW